MKAADGYDSSNTTNNKINIAMDLFRIDGNLNSRDARTTHEKVSTEEQRRRKRGNTCTI